MSTKLFDLGIDSKLRACDLVKLRVRDVRQGDRVASRGTVLQQKTQRPVQFEISPGNREAVEAWVRKAGLRSDDYLFPSRVSRSLIWVLASTHVASTISSQTMPPASLPATGRMMATNTPMPDMEGPWVKGPSEI